MIHNACVIALLILFNTVIFTHCLPNRLFNKKYREVRNIFLPNLELSKKYNHTYVSVNKTSTPQSVPTAGTSVKKWKVGRVSRKQYEIINMLWRKTKIFIDLETTTYTPGTKISNKLNNFQVSLRRPSLPTPTASYIEFYYLDENDDNVDQGKSLYDTRKDNKRMQQLSYNTASNIKRNLVDSLFWKFYTNVSPRNKIAQTLIPHFESAAKIRRDSVLQSLSSQLNKTSINKLKLYQSKKYAINKYNSNLVEQLRKHFLGNELYDVTTFVYETCPYTTTISTITHNTTLADMNVTDDNIGRSFETASKAYNATILTTIYDKIRFFEIYDQSTEDYNISYIDSVLNGLENKVSPKYYNYSVEKILLEHVDENIGHQNGSHIGRFAKKHISRSDLKNNVKDFTSTILKSTITLKLVQPTQEELNLSKLYLKHDHVRNVFNATWRTFSNLSKEAAWLDYPFAAVYIYEPSQVRCDAAGISPHWLITSASCLSRHRLDDSLSKYRSAFVTYCGVNWNLPARIAYVKFSLTHPKYNPTQERKYSYNVGLIKVVNSMSSCSGWYPISLMSHRYSSQEGSVVAAVGWGLDRYVPRYSEIPLCPLMVYESQIFTDSCPGNHGYSKAKRSNNIFNTQNIYCLTLPPYYGEKYDPVHGSLLLAGGKLIALYLQEERRPWGDQSALYTSIWRLIPWVHSVAQEPELDSFIAEI